MINPEAGIVSKGTRTHEETLVLSISCRMARVSVRANTEAGCGWVRSDGRVVACVPFYSEVY